MRDVDDADIARGMQHALDEADARSARRLAQLLDGVLPFARRAFEEGEPIPEIIIEAEDVAMTVLGGEPLLAEPAAIDADDVDLAIGEAPCRQAGSLETLEAALFEAARLTEKINAHRIAGLEAPSGALADQRQALDALKRHLNGSRRGGLKAWFGRNLSRKLLLTRFK